MPNKDLFKLKIEKTGPAAINGRKMRRIRLAVILLVLLSLTTGLYYFADIFAPATDAEVALVAQVYPSQTFTLLNAGGYIVAQRKASVASKVTGRLIAMSVEEGIRVKKGEVIARLENEDVAAQKDQAEATLNMARAGLEQAKAELEEAMLSFNRMKELYGQSLVTKADYDASEARHKKAAAAVSGANEAINANRAALQAAKVSVGYTLIKSPFDAVVLTKNADIGDIVTPLGAAANAKASVVTIADMNSLQAEVDVSESNLRDVKIGQPCEIQLDALPDSRFRGEVHMIVPTAERSKATVLVKVRFLEKDSRILPEMSARVAFLQRPVKPGEEKPRIAVTPSAIITEGNQKAVFLLKDNRAVKTPVTLGGPLGDLIEVIEGLRAGDRIIARPPGSLKNGTKIKTAEK